MSGRFLPPFRLNNINLNIQFPLLVFDTFAELKARSISSLRSISRGFSSPPLLRAPPGKRLKLIQLTIALLFRESDSGAGGTFQLFGDIHTR